MRSRTARLTICTIAWLALGAAAYFLFASEQQISQRRAAARTFDIHAREGVDALANVRAAQQAYVAEGQGVPFWMPKVSALIKDATTAVDRLRETSASADALGALDAAANTITEFDSIDQRAREYLNSHQQLMAADVVFTEGGETAAAAMRRVEMASVAEHQALDAFEAGLRQAELYALAGAGGFAAVVLALLAFTPRLDTTPAEPASATHAESGGALRLRDGSLGRLAVEVPRGTPPALESVAQLCTEFSRVKDLADLTKLLAQAADLMEASGLIVWLGNSAGADLRPVMAHGYPPQTLARMPVVPRAAENAAATAYRTGSLQIVLARPGSSSGALVAPLLSPDGCIGALTAEVKGGGEASDSVQSLAAIIAAQLASVLGPTTAAEPASAQRVASS